MTTPSATGPNPVLWSPSAQSVVRAAITRYMRWLAAGGRYTPSSYDDLWRWSVTDVEAFWASVWDYFGVVTHSPYTSVLRSRQMPGAKWFPGATLNYAEHALRRQDDTTAVVFRSEGGAQSELTYRELRAQVAAAAAGLRRLGVGKGDRVVAYMPNIPETLIAFLATASIGAIWSACSPEFGIRSVVDRFRQIEPKVLIAVDGYRYRGKAHDRSAELAEIRRELPSLRAMVIVPYLSGSADLAHADGTMRLEQLLEATGELAFEPIEFDHPLWVLYSSGTTGLPKPIVHGHGGILLEHLKAISLHMDIGEGDRFFWFTTTGWMMWNYLIGGLLVGATVVMYDGDPAYPDMSALWKMAAETGVTYFGTSAPFIHACMKAGIEPGRDFDLSRIRGVGSTGAPLSPEGFRWVYEKVNRNLLLGSFSGGTDLCTGFVGPCPLLPVRAGEIQCRCLGAKVEAYSPDGMPLVSEVGELVITAPMPSMPVRFWNDPGDRRYRESYFDAFPGVWRHGDWIRITERGACVISGRSDSTLKRGGVRMGTSDFYRAVEDVPEVVDSLVIDTGRDGEEGKLLLFLVLRPGAELEEPLRKRVREKLRRELSPRHVPDEIYAIPEVPRTINGKKLEVPVKRILCGMPPDQAASKDAMANPAAMAFFEGMAATVGKP
ncbi:MAG: acetoacetate--CoA ligase [SAR202 cluster bacterium]|nr:acetoacetate--CoA ligase [SAR202 cluster bacterium]